MPQLEAEGNALPGTIEIRARPVDRHGTFAVTFAGDTICHRTRMPALDAARHLLALGHPAGATLIMWHDGVPSLRGRLGVLARLTVEDDRLGRPRFRRWRGSRSDGAALPVVPAGVSVCAGAAS